MTDKGIFDLSGKVALVTGGARGLGREICEAMAEFGADVACNYLTSQKEAEEFVEYAKKLGRRAIAVQADVSKADEVKRMVDQAVAELGGVDILFNNAAEALGGPMPVHQLPLAAWDRTLAVDLTGPFLCMRYVIPHMLKKKRGSIINITSISGLMAGQEEWSLPPVPAYGAVKAGLIGLTKHSASGLAKYGIRVNAIAPGAHLTNPKGFPPALLKKMEEKISKFTPMGRPGEAREIKGLAVYLASEASSFVTGQTIVEDGGFSI